MGNKNSGRRRKPRELKVLEGGFRKDRHGDEPEVVLGWPKAPEALTRTERELWDALPKVPWIVSSDVIAVHGAVSLYDRILRNQRAQQATAEAGAPLAYKVLHDMDGGQTLEPKENPLISQELKLWARLFSVLGTLGLTPADRAKMRMPKVTDALQDKWAGLL